MKVLKRTNDIISSKNGAIEKSNYPEIPDSSKDIEDGKAMCKKCTMQIGLSMCKIRTYCR